jgi:hypothetical protein
VRPRDAAEHAIRRFHALEIVTGADPVIDYDCAPTDEVVQPYPDRLAALDELSGLIDADDDGPVAEQLTAHTTYLAALLGERRPLDDYVRRTQGCPARGWTSDYLDHRRTMARNALAQVGVPWDTTSRDRLRAADDPVDPTDIGEVISALVTEHEPLVRELARTTAEFRLTIEPVQLDAYWSYWLDGAGHNARLRINTANASFTHTDAYRFALHEVLGHAMQYAGFTTHAERHDVSWPRLLAVHSTHQVLCEGLAQLLPLVVRPHDCLAVATARLDHYLQLVRAEVHVRINTGATVAECRDLLHVHAPFVAPEAVERELRDRSRNPRLRTYLWSYPAGIDWFVNLLEQRPELLPEVVRAAYERPLGPSALHQLWPQGPRIGGNR